MRNFALAAFALLAGTSVASAGTIKIVPDMNGAYYKTYLTNVSISRDGGATYLKNVLAGQYRVKIKGSVGSFLTYCLETDERLASSTGTIRPLSSGDDIRGGLGTKRAAEISQLFGRFQKNFDTQVDKTTGSAIALAIWEIADEAVGAPLNLSTGAFRVRAPAAVLTLAQSYLDALTNKGPRLTNLYAIVIPKYQDLLIHKGSSQVIVAEPGVVGLLGLGALGLIAARRRMRR
jgi:hypothetical protein